MVLSSPLSTCLGCYGVVWGELRGVVELWCLLARAGFCRERFWLLALEDALGTRTSLSPEEALGLRRGLEQSHGIQPPAEHASIKWDKALRMLWEG